MGREVCVCCLVVCCSVVVGICLFIPWAVYGFRPICDWGKSPYSITIKNIHLTGPTNHDQQSWFEDFLSGSGKSDYLKISTSCGFCEIETDSSHEVVVSGPGSWPVGKPQGYTAAWPSPNYKTICSKDGDFSVTLTEDDGIFGSDSAVGQEILPTDIANIIQMLPYTNSTTFYVNIELKDTGIFKDGSIFTLLSTYACIPVLPFSLEDEAYQLSRQFIEDESGNTVVRWVAGKVAKEGIDEAGNELLNITDPMFLTDLFDPSGSLNLTDEQALLQAVVGWDEEAINVLVTGKICVFDALNKIAPEIAMLKSVAHYSIEAVVENY